MSLKSVVAFWTAKIDQWTDHRDTKWGHTSTHDASIVRLSNELKGLDGLRKISKRDQAYEENGLGADRPRKLRGSYLWKSCDRGLISWNSGESVQSKLRLKDYRTEILLKKVKEAAKEQAIQPFKNLLAGLNLRDLSKSLYWTSCNICPL